MERVYAREFFFLFVELDKMRGGRQSHGKVLFWWPSFDGLDNLSRCLEYCALGLGGFTNKCYSPFKLF